MDSFLKRFERYSSGLDGLSVGPWPTETCSHCSGDGIDPATVETIGDGITSALVLDEGEDCDQCNGRGNVCRCGSCEDFDAEVGDEGSFSWSCCDTCGSALGSNRYAAHCLDGGYDSADPGIVHLDVCADCLVYIANGDVPDNEEEEGAED